MWSSLGQHGADAPADGAADLPPAAPTFDSPPTPVWGVPPGNSQEDRRLAATSESRDRVIAATVCQGAARQLAPRVHATAYSFPAMPSRRLACALTRVFCRRMRALSKRRIVGCRLDRPPRSGSPAPLDRAGRPDIATHRGRLREERRRGRVFERRVCFIDERDLSANVRAPPALLTSVCSSLRARGAKEELP